MSLYLDLRISHLSCCVLSERQGWDCFHIRPVRKQISLSAPQPEIRDNILSFSSIPGFSPLYLQLSVSTLSDILLFVCLLSETLSSPVARGQL